MNNDLSSIDLNASGFSTPYCIWQPTVPHSRTLELLVALRPDMLPQASRACIVGDYQDFYDQFDPPADFGLIAEAEASSNPHYLSHLEAKVEKGEFGKDGVDFGPRYHGWKRYTKNHLFTPGSSILNLKVEPSHVQTCFDGILDSVMVDISTIELHVSATSPDPGGVTRDVNPGFERPIKEELLANEIAFLDWEYRQQLERMAAKTSDAANDPA